MLVTIFTAAIFADVPAEVISLFFSFIQTIISIISLIDYEEECSMANSLLVASGTHGVVLNLLELENVVTSAE